jgi:hypothetical protein
MDERGLLWGRVTYEMMESYWPAVARRRRGGAVGHPRVGGQAGGQAEVRGAVDAKGLPVDELEILSAPPDEPRLVVPDVSEILRRAGIEGSVEPTARRAVLAAMRKATEKRLSGVTEEKRRRHYGHAASLVALCLACQRSPATLRWVESIRTEYRRFPALRAEIDRHLGKT